MQNQHWRSKPELIKLRVFQVSSGLPPRQLAKSPTTSGVVCTIGKPI